MVFLNEIARIYLLYFQRKQINRMVIIERSRPRADLLIGYKSLRSLSLVGSYLIIQGFGTNSRPNKHKMHCFFKASI